MMNSVEPAERESKTCTGCNMEQPISAYCVDRCTVDGYSYRCSWCRKRPKYLKLCSHCNEEKPRSAFSKATKSRDGLQSQCKDCMKLLRRKLARTGTTQDTKACAACGLTLPMSRFHKDESKSDGRSGSCKDCYNRRKAEQRKVDRDARSAEGAAKYVAPVTVEHEPGSKGWARMREAERARTENAFERMRANREEVMGR